MAESRNPGSPERNLSWRNGGEQGRGPQSNNPCGGDGDNRSRRNRGSGSEGRSRRGQGSSPRLNFKIPESKIGKLIGRKGRNIHELQDATGTYIDVSREENAGKVSVFISGTPESQRRCKEMILDFIRERRNESGSDRSDEEGCDRPSESGSGRRNEAGGDRPVEAGRDRRNESGNGRQNESGNDRPVDADRDRPSESGSGRRNEAGSDRPVEAGRGRPNEARRRRRDEFGRGRPNEARRRRRNEFGRGRPNEARRRRTVEESATDDENGDRVFEVDWNILSRRIDYQERRRLIRQIPFRKYFYVEAQEVAEMSDDYVYDLRRALSNIKVSFPFGGSGIVPNPVETFEQAFQFYPRLLSHLRRQNFQKPFPIQSQGWPILLTGNDMIGIAQTGTGKTLTFLLPALVHLDGQDDPLSERIGPNVLIIAPTRELALQLEGEVRKFPYHGARSICLYGGAEREEQMRELQDGINLVIGTPGRLNDCVLTGALALDIVTYVVLDEADHMLDLGFEPQILKLLRSLRRDRQTVMTSATWSDGVQDLAVKYMRNPIKVLVGSTGLAVVHTVSQIVYVVKEEKKFDHLMEVIDTMEPNDKMIIFVGKKTLADSLASNLISKGIPCQSIHGSKSQSDREQTLDNLRTGTLRIMVATDIASRGLDIEDVTKVVNFDFPYKLEDYVNRVGRTGRAGKTGEAVTFFTKANRCFAADLIRILDEAGQIIPERLLEMSTSRDQFLRSRDERRRGHNTE